MDVWKYYARSTFACQSGKPKPWYI